MPKTSLKNQKLGNGENFAIIASSSHPILLAKHDVTNGLVEAPLRHHDDAVCFANPGISPCSLADYVAKKRVKLHTARAARLFFLVQRIRSLFSAIVVSYKTSHLLGVETFTKIRQTCIVHDTESLPELGMACNATTGEKDVKDFQI